MLSVTEFPRTPSGHLKRNITDEADARLAFYLPPDEPPPPGVEAPPRPQLPEGVIDAPLVRVFNFLRKFNLERFVLSPKPSSRDDVLIIPARDLVVSGP